MIFDIFRNILIADVYSKSVSQIIDKPHFIRIYGNIEFGYEPIVPMTKFTGTDQFEATYITRFAHLFMSIILNHKKEYIQMKAAKNNLNFFKMYSDTTISNVRAFGVPMVDDFQFALALKELMNPSGRNLIMKDEAEVVNGLSPFLLALPGITLADSNLMYALFHNIKFKPTTQFILEELMKFTSRRIYCNEDSYYTEDLADLHEYTADYSAHNTFARNINDACEIVLDTNSLYDTINCGMARFNNRGNAVAVIAAYLQSCDENYDDDIPDWVLDKIKDIKGMERITEKFERWVQG